MENNGRHLADSIRASIARAEAAQRNRLASPRTLQHALAFLWLALDEVEAFERLEAPTTPAQL